jgi:sporulation-control protein spo0M
VGNDAEDDEINRCPVTLVDDEVVVATKFDIDEAVNDDDDDDDDEEKTL